MLYTVVLIATAGYAYYRYMQTYNAHRIYNALHLDRWSDEDIDELQKIINKYRN